MKSALLYLILVSLAGPALSQQRVPQRPALRRPPKKAVVLPRLDGQWDVRLSTPASPDAEDGPEFQFDVLLRSSNGTTENLDNSGIEDTAFTSSACSASGNGGEVTATGNTSGAVTFKFTVDDNSYYLLTGTISNDGTTVSGTGVQFIGDSCGAGDAGDSFTATMYQSATGVFLGSFTPDAGGSPFSSTITIAEDSTFHLSGTVTANGNACFSLLTITNDPDPAVAAGNVVDFFALDTQGNLVGFVGNTGGTEDEPGDLTWENVFFTAVVYGGPCAGQSYTDDVFHRRVREPFVPKPLPNPRRLRNPGNHRPELP